MNLSRLVSFILGFVVSTLFFMISAYSICSSQPDSVIVVSGSDNLGEIPLGQLIYVNPNLQTDPLAVTFLFKNDQDACFDDTSVIEFQLISGGSFRPADSVSTVQNEDGDYVTSATFNYNLNSVITSTLTSNLRVSSTQGGDSTATVSFATESSDPDLSVTATPTQSIIAPGTDITISYTAQDLQSGISEITILPGGTPVTFSTYQTTHSDVFTQTIDSTQTYTITVTDNLGHTTSEAVTFTVDSDAPELSQFRLTRYTFSGTDRFASFSVFVQDDAFAEYSSSPLISADFSSFSSTTVQNGQCSQDGIGFTCFFQNVPLAITESQTVQIPVTVLDPLNNEKTESFSQELFVDLEGPVIEDFYSENLLGVRNVISPFDEEVKIILEFTDLSLTIDDSDPTIVENFDLIQFPVKEEGECPSGQDDKACYFWELGAGVGVFEADSRDTMTFEVSVTDYFGSETTSETELIIDKTSPEILEVTVEEVSSAADSLISSGEEILVRAIVKDTNMESSGDYFVFGDFSTVDFRDGQDKVRASCTSTTVDEEEVTECVFRDIIVESGYYLRDVIINVSDAAANNVIHTEPIEVFAISDDEVPAVYSISDIDVLNPLNRNVVLSSAVTAWFEGNLQENSEGYTIINYVLSNCNEADLNPLRVVDRELYPDNVVLNIGQDNLKDFTLKVDIGNHQNSPDLNDKTMACTMSVLFRDDTTIYQQGQQVDFNLNFGFFDIPRGDLLEANAQKVIDTIDEAESLGAWFDTTYDIYNIFASVCNGIYTARTITSSISSVWASTQIILSATIDLLDDGKLSSEIGRVAHGSNNWLGFLTDDKGPINTMCNFVTCRNGRLLGSITEGVGGAGFEKLLNLQNDLAEFACVSQEGS